MGDGIDGNKEQGSGVEKVNNNRLIVLAEQSLGKLNLNESDEG